jgi:SAM-dependent methyltransferase
MTEWWQDFFDADYIRLWGQSEASGSTAAQVEGIWSLLGLREGSRVLDAPCGYGRIARPLAERGATVLGVDQSRTLLDHAERERAGLPASRLRYLQHDLRTPLGEGGFDCALNLFTSLGCGTEDDDLALAPVRSDGSGEQAGVPADLHGDGARASARARRASLPIRAQGLLSGAFPGRRTGPRQSPRAALRARGVIDLRSSASRPPCGSAAGLSESGNREIAAMTLEAYDEKMIRWSEWIDHFLGSERCCSS